MLASLGGACQIYSGQDCSYINHDSGIDPQVATPLTFNNVEPQSDINLQLNADIFHNNFE